MPVLTITLPGTSDLAIGLDARVSEGSSLCLLKRQSTRDRSNVLKMCVRARRKYWVVIPRSVLIRLELRPGMELQVVEHNVRVEFLPPNQLNLAVFQGAGTGH